MLTDAGPEMLPIEISKLQIFTYKSDNQFLENEQTFVSQAIAP